MLELVPKGLFSYDYTVLNDGLSIATLHTKWIREAGYLEIQGINYAIHREGMTGDFLLSTHGEIIVQAHKHMRRIFDITYNNFQYQLRAQSMRRTFELLVADQVIGWVAPRGVLSRKALVDLPADLPLHVQLFFAWLVLLMWKRDNDSATAVGALSG